MMVLADSVDSDQVTCPASKPGFASSCTGGDEVLCQLPFPSQICFCPFAHWVAPGTHEPLQVPFAHTKGQAAPSCHRPVVLQVCGTLFAHWRAPGEHDPAHWPFVHTNGQEAPDCQSPVELQVWGMLPLQPVSPGLQRPE